MSITEKLSTRIRTIYTIGVAMLFIAAILTVSYNFDEHVKVLKELKGLNGSVITGKYDNEISLINKYDDVQVFFVDDDKKERINIKDVNLASTLGVHQMAMYTSMFEVEVKEDIDVTTVLIKKHVMSGVEG